MFSREANQTPRHSELGLGANACCKRRQQQPVTFCVSQPDVISRRTCGALCLHFSSRPFGRFLIVCAWLCQNQTFRKKRPKVWNAATVSDSAPTRSGRPITSLMSTNCFPTIPCHAYRAQRPSSIRVWYIWRNGNT